MDAAAPEFDEEHVQPAEPERVDREEIAGDHRLGVRPEQLVPREAAALARRAQPLAAQDLADAGGGDAKPPEAANFSGDPLIPPARVLACEPQHQFADLPLQLRSATPATRIRPASAHEVAMPTNERVRRNEERPPACPWKKPTRRSQERPVSRLDRRTRDLPADDCELVPEHDNLQLLELLRTHAQ